MLPREIHDVCFHRFHKKKLFSVQPLSGIERKENKEVIPRIPMIPQHFSCMVNLNGKHRGVLPMSPQHSSSMVKLITIVPDQ